MAKQIFFRMQISATEKEEILRKIKEGTESFSNINRRMWGFPKLDRSESLKGNTNKRGKTRKKAV